MAERAIKTDGDENNERRSGFTDETTRKKIDRHLHDINDTISAEDIRNVFTDISSDSAAADKEFIEPDMLTNTPETNAGDQPSDRVADADI